MTPRGLHRAGLGEDENLVPHGTPISSTAGSSTSAADAFDGSKLTQYFSNSLSPDCYLGMDFGKLMAMPLASHPLSTVLGPYVSVCVCA